PGGGPHPEPGPWADPYTPPAASPRDPAPPRPPGPSAEDETVATIIPYKNASALTAYYLGLFSCFPVLGLPLAVVAPWLRGQGMAAAKRDPRVHGTAHAWIGLVCGTIGLFISLFLIGGIALALLAGGRR